MPRPARPKPSSARVAGAGTFASFNVTITETCLSFVNGGVLCIFNGTNMFTGDSKLIDRAAGGMAILKVKNPVNGV